MKLCKSELIATILGVGLGLLCGMALFIFFIKLF